MADDAEKKNISRLDFKIDDAINSLTKVDEKLKNIAKTSEAYANTISKNMKKGLDAGLLVDTSNVKKNLQNVENLSKGTQEQMLKNAQKSELRQTEIVLQETEKRRTAEYRHMLEQEQYNERVAKSTENLYDKITQYAKTYVIYQGFNALKKGIQETIDEMVELEYRMVEIDRVLNETGLDMDVYRDKLIQLAYDYGNSFDNVSDITLRLAKAGFDAQESLALTEKTLLALNTAELNATEATDDMVAVMAQWGLMTGDANEEAKAYGDIIDKINKVADNFPTTSQDIMNALKKVSSAFNLAGADIDETIATIVAAEKASQRGGKVIGTALSNIVQQIKAEGKLNLAEQLGLDFFKDDAKTEFKPIMEIFQEMSDRMAQLKAQGKESSVEMQNLLELFTVFRRNIGASLLGEMAGGEESTYMQVFKMSVDSAGYSLQENEKYLKTAKAAQAQFNAELLKLKTEVWDNGLEDTFREMLKFGTDLVQNISKIIDTFGVLPTTIGVAVGAFTAFNKKIQAFTYDSKTGNIQLNGFLKSVADGTKAVRESNKAIIEMKNGQMALNLEGEYSAKIFGKNVLATGKYAASLVASTAKTIALQVATVALNAAISIGLSLAISAIISGIDNWIHKTERMIEANTELMKTAQDNAEKIRTERESLEDLSTQLEDTAKKYNELDESDSEKTSITAKLYELQTQINEALEGTGKRVDIINETLTEQGEKVISINKEWKKQIEILDQVSYKKKVEEIEQLEKAMKAANKNLELINSETLYGDFGSRIFGGNANALAAGFVKAGISEDMRTIFGSVNDAAAHPQLQEFSNSNIENQIRLLKEWQTKLKMVNDGDEDVSKSLELVEKALTDVNNKYNQSISATEEYNNALKELYGESYRLVGYQSVLQGIMDTYGEDEGVKNLINNLQQLNQSFADGKITSDQYYASLEEQMKNIRNVVEENGEGISQGMQAIFAETTKYIAEGIDSAISSYEEGTNTFYEYQDALSQSANNLIELYGIQNGLTESIENGNKVWKDAEGNINDYATSLQNTANTVSSFSEMMEGLAQSYDYVKEHVDDLGNANFEVTDKMTIEYQNLASNFANSLAKMRATNYDAWAKIVNTMEDGSTYVGNTSEEVDTYVANALANNNNNLNNALNEANRQSQEATTKLGISTGNVLEKLGDAISNFDYDIKATPYITGGFGLKTNEFGLPIGIQLPSFGFNISGSGGSSVRGLAEALKTFGSDVGTYVNSKTGYNSLLQTINPYKSSNKNPFTGGTNTPTNYDTPTTTSPSGGGGSSSSRSTPTYDTNDRAAEDEYKSQLNLFKAYVTEKERLEKRWVDKQKELGLLSNYDYVAITQERIERYKEYLDALKDATWMNEEDRLALEKEYTEKIEDLQVDYLKYLKNVLNDEINALKKANNEKIQLLKDESDRRIQVIKDEADKRIKALQDIKEETSKLKKEEDYKSKRSEILENISYWRQRTGKQAQESLKEAKENLVELDEEWKEQQEAWAIEEQIAKIEEQRENEIKAIEAERDAGIKAIEEMQEKQIAAMQEKYDKIVNDFNKTGQLVYENDVNWSKKMTDQKVALFAEADNEIYANESKLTKNLYNQYKDNFIDPIKKELENINKINAGTTASSTKTTIKTTTKTTTANTNPVPKPEPQYVDYTVQRGDSLWAIANRIYGDGSKWTKIYDANKGVIGSNPNLIYAGQTYKIPKFHGGGIFGGLDEGTAILKRGEMVLKPEWTASMERMMKFLDNVSSGTTNNITNGPTIEVSGDLVRIEASVRNQTDIDALGRKVESILKDKFNIKK